ncbi:MAG: hypothetical protein A2527_08325 [Candidatus Lambdaproteobacteria bacterium RIFOXYD2_FULL_50_16]|uniref:NnrS family protein n=1 Tax=Candidatus Lambdaproteobacteria bacterium RIFOXYD2_FULL_50_16 TaxID=1817772 RepID=A0A1F6GAN0_9PROT|nr:MAG: hypothetical protein A2527_08325 [Candidatus Lambdaproteobacteria bacterium RIFOXYD2_FULL_50_16]
MYQGISLDQAPPLFVPLRFFLSAPLFVVLGGIELLWFGSDLIGAAYAEPAIAWIHLWTLGWLAMVMFGAYYQMIPVMIGGQVPAPYLSGWVHGLLALGVLLFQGYFLFPEFSPFWLAGISLGLSIGLFIGQIAWALVRVKGENRPTLSAMRLSLVCLGITWFLGLWLLAGHGGWGPEIHGVNRDLHLSFALFGWVGFLIIGVSLHLVPMFYITPPFDKLVAQRVLRLLSITLVLLTFIQLTGIEAWLWVPVAFGFSGFGLYLFELTKILNRRRRKKVDPAARLLYLAIAWGWVALGLFVLGLWGKDLALKEGAVLIFLLGVSVNFTHGMLYKIVPFLIWFHRYSARVGEPGVPLMGDLLTDPQAYREGLILNGSLAALLVGYSLGAPVLFGLAALGLVGGHLYLIRLFYLALNPTPKAI